MKKISLIICFCLIFVVLSSCSREDLSEEAREAWRYAEAHGYCDQEGEFKCYNNNANNIWSMRCTDGNWNEFEECPFACNETTGKCYDPDNPSDPNNPTDPTDPTNPTDPTDPTNPADPTNPTNPTNPTDPTDPADPASCSLDESILDDCISSGNYCFAFKGEGVINADGSYSESYIDDAAAILLGFESSGKHLEYAQENSTFFSTTFNESQAVELLVRGDPAFGEFGNTVVTTLVETYIPLVYIDAMKEIGSDRLAAAPVSRVYDILPSSDSQYAKQCLIAANRFDYAPDFGQDMPVGATQVCYGENDSFGVGETFRLAMRADLVVDQEELLQLQGVDSQEDLCKCFELGSNSEVDCSVFINDEPENPCDLNPCNGVVHSTGVCHMEDSSNYSCECDDPCWFWDGEACIHDDSCGE